MNKCWTVSPSGRPPEHQRPADGGERRISAGTLQPRRHGNAEALHVVGRQRQGHHPAGRPPHRPTGNVPRFPAFLQLVWHEINRISKRLDRKRDARRDERNAEGRKMTFWGHGRQRSGLSFGILETDSGVLHVGKRRNDKNSKVANVGEECLSHWVCHCFENRRKRY